MKDKAAVTTLACLIDQCLDAQPAADYETGWIDAADTNDARGHPAPAGMQD